MSIRHETEHIKKMFYLSKELCEWLRVTSFTQKHPQSEIVSELIRKQIQSEREQEHERVIDKPDLQRVEAR